MKKIYFSVIVAALSSVTAFGQCIYNGDLESGIAGWNFKKRSQSFSIIGCAVDTEDPSFGTTVLSNVPNDFVYPHGTIVSEGLDPYLVTCSPPAFVQRVYEKKFAIKLNVNDGNADITSMWQYFASQSGFVSFNFAFSGQNSHQGDPDTEPFFTARILDLANNVIASYCLKLDNTDPIFALTNDSTTGGEILYTDWHCQTLIVPKDYIGKELKLEFVVTDCGASKDFGTVYLDNINCEKFCERTGKFGMIDKEQEEAESGLALSIFPNPVNDILTIAGANQGQTFVLTDIFGKQLMQANNTQGATEFTMNLSALAPGVYFLNTGTTVEKIVKK
ncbi:T9SS type A sorting domain-containing protein [Flavobacterium zepuense]|uniref:T9SS type A sorting domain-containing protein n=1 Tax=Flavobacterium zepuense TaxID=2593302 RepID=A0A552V2L0_9FLAO|nr:T9SS type A sorting domain-containing protein [Flavobacterium zepuense]TRW24704.1 T9SS type A sorting domain-containing protein [Flavobacterium zepuense]